MRGLLRAIAAVEILAAVFMAVLAVLVVNLRPGRLLDVLLLAAIGAAFTATAVFAGVQLWRLQEKGRIASICFLVLLMAFSGYEWLARGRPYVIVRLLLEAAMLAALLSRSARETCAAALSPE